MLQAGAAPCPPAADAPDVMACAMEPGEMLEMPTFLRQAWPGEGRRMSPPSAAAPPRRRGGFLRHFVRPSDDAEPDGADRPDLDSVAACATAAAALLERLRKALDEGTDGLARALWQARAELEELGRALQRLGADGEAARALMRVADDLDRLHEPPDSDETVKLWRTLEPMLEGAAKLGG
jgi:hypothetical protein